MTATPERDDERKPKEPRGTGRSGSGSATKPKPKRSNARLAVAGVIATVLLVSIGARFWVESSSASSGSRGGDSSSAIAPTGLLPDGSPAPGGDGTAGGEGEGAVPVSDGVADALPIVTEASFFGLIGFALGYASRKAVKLGLLAVAALFITLQTLVYLDVIAVDWSRAVSLVNDLVLNLREDQTIAEVAKAKIPTAGALVGGYFVGFRRG